MEEIHMGDMIKNIYEDLLKKFLFLSPGINSIGEKKTIHLRAYLMFFTEIIIHHQKFNVNRKI
jgi:hypothetical protein